MTENKTNIIETAIAAGSFTTLVKAITAAGLVDALKGAGPFTVFAPSEGAFSKLPAGTLDGLTKPENKDKLASILKLHVVPGKIMAADITGKQLSPTSLNGEALKVDGKNGVTVNNAKVAKPDIECSNGVIHVIEAVFMPSGKASEKAA
jgi:uncharacterized surface protein with fasciclin (FAS1) repeats